MGVGIGGWRFGASGSRQNGSSLQQVRAQIEGEVLGELADHPTIDFIKRIEDERSHYKTLLAEVGAAAIACEVCRS
jgi:hypothetical protein